MKRWVMRITTGVMVVMCVGVCALWVRSGWACDIVLWEIGVQRSHEYQWWRVAIESDKDLVDFSVNFNPWPGHKGRGRNEVSYLRTDDLRGPEIRVLWDGWRKSALGFGMMHAHRSEYSTRSVWVPHWFLAVVFGVLPVRRIYLWGRASRRRAKGLCVKCGYDMRGGGERCPECGEVVFGNTGGAPVPQ